MRLRDQIGPDRQRHGLSAVSVPSERVVPGDVEARLVLRRLDGLLLLPAYSSLDSLVACCGQDQPWVCLPVAGLGEVVAGVGADLVVLDAALQGPRYGSG